MGLDATLAMFDLYRSNRRPPSDPLEWRLSQLREAYVRDEITVEQLEAHVATVLALGLPRDERELPITADSELSSPFPSPTMEHVGCGGVVDRAYVCERCGRNVVTGRRQRPSLRSTR